MAACPDVTGAASTDNWTGAGAPRSAPVAREEQPERHELQCSTMRRQAVGEAAHTAQAEQGRVGRVRTPLPAGHYRRTEHQPSAKHQAPSTKDRAPSTAHQAPSAKHQAPGTEHTSHTINTQRSTLTVETGQAAAVRIALFPPRAVEHDVETLIGCNGCNGVEALIGCNGCNGVEALLAVAVRHSPSQRRRELLRRGVFHRPQSTAW